MDILGAFLLGRESRNNNLGTPIIIPFFIAMIMYNKFKEYVIANFTNYIFEMIIAVIFLTILIFRYSYDVFRSPVTRWGTYYLLRIINFPLCIVLSIVLFNHIGNTPFSLLVNWLNVLGWSLNNFTECMGEILWLVLKILDIATTIGGILFIQNIVLYFRNGSGKATV